MKKASTNSQYKRALLCAALLGTVAAESITQADGASCVAEVPRLILEEINTIRALDLTGTVYTLLEEYADSTSYLYRDGSSINCFASDQEFCTEEALDQFGNITYEIDPFEWSEGLALAAEDLVSLWKESGRQSLQQDDGSSTWSRVQQYGYTGGSVVEYAFWLDAEDGNTMKIQAVDCVLSMLIGDGDASKVARNAIFDTFGNSIFYDQLGAAVGTSDNSQLVMCDIIFAETYETRGDVAECGVTADFGGELCDPEDDDLDLFYWINWLRQHPDDATINDELEEILASFDEFGTISVFDYDGNGVNDMRGYSADGEENVSVAIQRLVDLTIDQSNDIYLDAFKWSPGLYFAAQEQAEWLADQDEVSTVGSSDTDTADRIQKYGEGNAYESFITGDNNALNMALTLLIDDLDLDKRSQKYLTSDDVVYMSLATANSDTFSTVTSVLFSEQYTTSSSLATCIETGTTTSDRTFSVQSGAAILAGSFIMATIALLF